MAFNRRSSGRIKSAAAQRRLKPEPKPAVKQFIKIILFPTIERKMMQVPEAFVKLGPKLSDIVTLETPVGFKRSIRIKRVGDEVWFDKGWNEFAEAHSLSEGYLLMFHYNENSSFSVVILDVSASEIDYPVETVFVIESDDDIKEVIDDDDDDDDDDDEKGFTRTVNNNFDEVITLDDDDDDDEEEED